MLQFTSLNYLYCPIFPIVISRLSFKVNSTGTISRFGNKGTFVTFFTTAKNVKVYHIRTGGSIMAVSRAGKFIVGALFVFTLILTAAHCLAADEAVKAVEPEAIATPSPLEQGSEALAPVSADTNSLAQESPLGCDAAGCTFEGVPLCSPPGRFWIRSDWLMWWTSGAHLPPLVTTSPYPQTSVQQAGVLGPDGTTAGTNTTIVLGNSDVYQRGTAGVRIVIGGWLDDCHRWALQGDWLTLGGQSLHFSQSSPNGSPIIARPFYDVDNGVQNSEVTAYPGFSSGSVDIQGKDSFESQGMTLRYNLNCNSCPELCANACETQCGECSTCIDPCSAYYYRTDLLAGFRRYVLADQLVIYEDTTRHISADFQPRLQLLDGYFARNEFYGGELGLATELRRGRYSLNMSGKMALGNNHQTASITGSSIFTLNGQSEARPVGHGGLPSNNGTYVNNQFVVIPQFDLELGYQLSCHWRAFVGYSVLYWAPVMRASDQIDNNIQVSQWEPPFTEAKFPAFPNAQTNYWAHGLNLGAEMRF
jgi:hypothetical protein